jgi:hypothetical protein
MEEAQEQAQPGLIPGLSEGRIVHFVLSRGPSAGQHRPAIVVKDWKLPSGVVNLVVFLDGTNDTSSYYHDMPVTKWETSVAYSEDPKPFTWHWPERA